MFVLAKAELRGFGARISGSALAEPGAGLSPLAPGAPPVAEASAEGRRRLLTLAEGLDIDARPPAALGGLIPGLEVEDTDDCLVLWAGSGGGPIDVLAGLGLTPTLVGRVLEGVFVRELEALDAGMPFVGDFVGDYKVNTTAQFRALGRDTNPYPGHAGRPRNP